MTDQFLGEIRIMSFNFAPRDWAKCDGQLMPVQQNQPLYALIGNIYGGTDINFSLPDFRGRMPMHVGQGYPQGGMTGLEKVALTGNELPGHSHTYKASMETADNKNPSGRYLPTGSGLYTADATEAGMGPDSISYTGGGQSHENMPPFLVLNFCIALYGTWPPRS